MEGGFSGDRRENQRRDWPLSRSVLEGGNENSLGQIPRETSDYWTSKRTVRHTSTERWRNGGGFPGGSHRI